MDLKKYSYNRLIYIDNKPEEQRTEDEKQYLADYIADQQREQQRLREERERIEANKIESEKLCRAYWKKIREKEIAKKSDTSKYGVFLLTNYDEVTRSIVNNYDYIVRKQGGAMSELSRRLCSMLAYKLTNEGDTKQWIYIAGGVGTGKSTVALAAKQTIEHVAGKVMRIINAANINDIKKNNPDEWQRLVHYPFLCIDDFGVETVKAQQWGATEYPIVELLYNRYDKRLFTMFTSNIALTSPDMSLRYGLRVADRLAEMCYQIPVYQKTSFR